MVRGDICRLVKTFFLFLFLFLFHFSLFIFFLFVKLRQNILGVSYVFPLKRPRKYSRRVIELLAVQNKNGFYNKKN